MSRNNSLWSVKKFSLMQPGVALEAGNVSGGKAVQTGIDVNRSVRYNQNML